MENQKIDLIIEKLIEQTKSGKLQWKKTSNTYTYLLALKDSSISLTNNPFGYGFICDFRNSNGEVVESISVIPTEPSYGKIKELFDNINRKHLKTDETIDSILEQLAA